MLASLSWAGVSIDAVTAGSFETSAPGGFAAGSVAGAASVPASSTLLVEESRLAEEATGVSTGGARSSLAALIVFLVQIDELSMREKG